MKSRIKTRMISTISIGILIGIGFYSSRNIVFTFSVVIAFAFLISPAYLKYTKWMDEAEKSLWSKHDAEIARRGY